MDDLGMWKDGAEAETLRPKRRRAAQVTKQMTQEQEQEEASHERGSRDRQRGRLLRACVCVGQWLWVVFVVENERLVTNVDGHSSWSD